MIRLLMFLLGRNYEPCKSCETLRQQLEFINAEKKELTNTLLEVLKPQPQVEQVIHVPNQQIPLSTVNTFSRRRAALESRDRETAKTIKDSPLMARPDNLKDTTINDEINKLEAELSLNEPAEEKEKAQ